MYLVYLVNDFFKNRKFVFFLLFFITAVKFLLSFRLELIPDEAYYWEWSRNLDLSFYDQGPGIAVYIKLFTTLFGNQFFALKIAALFASFVVAYILYLIGYSLKLNGFQLFWLFTLTQLIPGFVGGAALIMHDSALLLFWGIALWSTIRFLQEEKPIYLYLLFICLGFGALSKHTMVFFVVSIFLWLVLNPKEFRIFQNVHLYLGILLAGFIVAPMIFWNYKNDWHNIDAIINLRSAGGAQAPSNNTGLLIAGQVLSLSPFWFIGSLLSIYFWTFRSMEILKYFGLRTKEYPDLERNSVNGFLFANAIVLPGFFFIMSFTKVVQANWVYPAFLPGIVLLSHLILNSPETNFEKFLSFMIKYGTIFAIIFGVYTFFSRDIVNIGKLNIEPYYIPEYRAKGFVEIANRVQKEKERIGGDLSVIANRYQDAAILSFNLPGQPFVKSFNIMQKNQYNIWDGPEFGKDYLLVHIQENTCEKSFIFYQPFLKKMFEQVTEFPETDIYLDGKVIKRYQIWHLQNYRESWALPMSNYLTTDFLQTLVPNMTLGYSFSSNSGIVFQGLDLLNSYYTRSGELDCQVFK